LFSILIPIDRVDVACGRVMTLIGLPGGISKLFGELDGWAYGGWAVGCCEIVACDRYLCV
jgi:hypothetical protein